MANKKPYLAAACVCEAVLIEQDGVGSLIRVIDTIHLPPAQTAMPQVPIGVNFKVFVSVKSGDLVGAFELGLVVRGPEEDTRGSHKWTVVFGDSPESGANLKIEFNLTGKEPGKPPTLGLYWFDVIWGEEVLTSIPLRLTLAAPPMPAQGPNKP